MDKTKPKKKGLREKTLPDRDRGSASGRARIQYHASIADEFPPLPPYMREHINAQTGVRHFRCDVSTRMRLAGFPVPNLKLGTDIHRALALYEDQFAPVLRAWKEDAAAIALDYTPVYGSLEWAHVEYKKTERYFALAEESKRTYDTSIRRSCKHIVKAGRFAGQRWGTIPLRSITEADADAFYAEHVKIEIDVDGRTVVGRRARTAKTDIETLRAMVNALKRKYECVLYKKANVFTGVYMPYRPANPEPVLHEWLARFVRMADSKGLDSVSAIALFAFELEARVTHFPTQMRVDHFRGPNHEDEVFVDAVKTHEMGWFRLWDDEGSPMYPELTKRLAKLKGNRYEGPMFLSERADRMRPWTIRELRDVVKEICAAAKLPSLNLSQFRKGGMAEANLSGLTPAEFVATSMHKDFGTVLKHYTQRNSELAMAGQKKRLNLRKIKAKRGVDIVT